MYYIRHVDVTCHMLLSVYLSAQTPAVQAGLTSPLLWCCVGAAGPVTDHTEDAETVCCCYFFLGGLRFSVPQCSLGTSPHLDTQWRSQVATRWQRWRASPLWYLLFSSFWLYFLKNQWVSGLSQSIFDFSPLADILPSSIFYKCRCLKLTMCIL